MSKIDEYTVDNLAKSDDKDVVEGAVKDLQKAFATEAKNDGRYMIAAAYATVAALRSGSWTKTGLMNDWAVPNPLKPGTMKKKSLSTITLYDRLGQAAVKLGVTPEGPVWDPKTASNRNPTTVWTLLAGSGGATISAVGQYIENGKPLSFDAKGNVTEYDGQPTLDGLLDLLRDYFGPDGAKIAKDVRAKNEFDRRKALGSKEVPAEEPEVPTVPNTGSIEAMFRVALGDVARLADQISTEQWNSKEIQTLLGKAHTALKDKVAFEKKNAAASEKATA